MNLMTSPNDARKSQVTLSRTGTQAALKSIFCTSVRSVDSRAFHRSWFFLHCNPALGRPAEGLGQAQCHRGTDTALGIYNPVQC